MTAAQEAVPIYKGQDFYVPYFEVRLKGKSLSQDVVRDIIQVSYKDSLDAIDSFDLTINNWDAESRSFKYSDEEIFDPGQELELWMGYYGADHQRRMMLGEITSLRPAFPAGGQPTLSVSVLNILHKFRTEQVSWVYEELTDSEIALQVGQRLAIEVETDPVDETPYEYILQDNQYDIIFLMRQARKVGYDIFVKEGDTPAIYFGPSVNVKQTTYELVYGRSLIQFQPTLTTANQVGEVTVRGWDPTSKKKIEYTARRSEIETQGVGEGQSRIESAFNQKKEILNEPVRSEAEAKKVAVETLENIAKDMVKGSGSVVGLPDLRAGTVVFIRGLGDRFSGRYFVTGTTHTIGGSGYTTQFQCRMEEV